MFGHWFEILIVVFVGLLVFGPKRMIEMGSQVGRMVRDLRASTRDLNFSSLLSADEPSKHPTYNYTTPTTVADRNDESTYEAEPPADTTTIEGGIQRPDDIAG